MQQAINRAFTILEYTAAHTENPVSFNDIAKHAGLNTGTCANIIKALVIRGYLEKLDDKKGYLIGKKLYQLTGADNYRKDILAVSKPVVDALTEKLNENALVAVMKENERLVLYQTKSKHDVQANSTPNKNAYDSATGRIMIAMQTNEEAERFIAKYGLPSAAQWKEAVTRKNFLQEIAAIRKHGYALQESARSISGIAAAIYRNHTVVAAISIYMPSFRLVDANRPVIIESVKKAAEKISAELSD